MPAQAGGLYQAIVSHGARDGYCDRADARPVTLAQRSQVGGYGIEYLVRDLIVRALRPGDFRAAELGHGNLPRLVAGGDGNRRRATRVRLKVRRGPAAQASTRRRTLAEEAEAGQPGHGLGDQAARRGELAGERCPVDTGLAMHQAQNRHGRRCLPPFRHRCHVAFLLSRHYLSLLKHGPGSQFTRSPTIIGNMAAVTVLSLITVLAWGTWIPLAQAVRDVPQRTRTLYVTIGNFVFAGAAFAAAGHLVLDWRRFWLPLAGGIVWTAGNYSAFRASESIGLARAAGSWTPLNIIIAFGWGAGLFGELDGFSDARFAELAGALLLILVGVLVIVWSQHKTLAGATWPSIRPRAARL